ncbi:MAG: hypothetical protein HUK25_03485 [Treponema sp.]|nr:hypothetical protein [Treponema sp.]
MKNKNIKVLVAVFMIIGALQIFSSCGEKNLSENIWYSEDEPGSIVYLKNNKDKSLTIITEGEKGVFLLVDDSKLDEINSFSQKLQITLPSIIVNNLTDYYTLYSIDDERYVEGFYTFFEENNSLLLIEMSYDFMSGRHVSVYEYKKVDGRYAELISEMKEPIQNIVNCFNKKNTNEVSINEGYNTIIYPNSYKGKGICKKALEELYSIEQKNSDWFSFYDYDYLLETLLRVIFEDTNVGRSWEEVDTGVYYFFKELEEETGLENLF